MESSNPPELHEINTSKQPAHRFKISETSTPAGESLDLPKEETPADMEAKLENPTSKEKPPADMEVKLENTTSEVESGDDSDKGEEEEEQGECGFCLYMKGGGCKEAFINWEKCVEEAEEKKEDIVEKCYQVTTALKKCMDAHPDYYGPILQAEKAAEEEAVRQLEEEDQKETKETEKPQ